jgi:hypothetical protein
MAYVMVKKEECIMILAFIPIVGSIFDFLLGNIINLAGGIGAIFMAMIIWLTKKYLVPFLKVESRRRYAAYIAAIADEVTDELRQLYPNKPWIGYLDEAVDKIIDICDVDPDIAKRAASAAFSRK